MLACAIHPSTYLDPIKNSLSFAPSLFSLNRLISSIEVGRLSFEVNDEDILFDFVVSIFSVNLIES